MSGGVVGVTGHRAAALEGVPLQPLEQQIDRVLASLAERGHDRLVSGLAEGADRIVAWRALAAGWTVDALLPLEESRYLADFGSAASRAEFRELLARAGGVTVAAGAPPYAAQGRALVERSGVLLALWDGAPARGPGGTAEVVQWARDHGVPVVWIHLDPPHPVQFMAAAGGG